MENPPQESVGSSQRIDTSSLLCALHQDETICKLRKRCGLTIIRASTNGKVPWIEMKGVYLIDDHEIILRLPFDGNLSIQEVVTYIRETFEEIIKTPYDPSDCGDINYTDLSANRTNQSLLHQFILQYKGDYDLAYTTFPIQENPLTQRNSSEHANLSDLATWLASRKALKQKMHACGAIECFWQNGNNVHMIHRIEDYTNWHETKKEAMQSIRRTVLQASLRKELDDEQAKSTNSIRFISTAEDGGEQLTRDGDANPDDEASSSAYLINAPTIVTDRYGRVTDESRYEFQRLCELLRESQKQHGKIQVLVNMPETVNPLEEWQNAADKTFERKVKWFLPAQKIEADPETPQIVQEVDETVENNSLQKELMSKLEEQLSSDIFESICVDSNDMRGRTVSLVMELKRNNGKFSLKHGLDDLCYTLIEIFRPNRQSHLQVIDHKRIDGSTILVTVKLQVAKKKNPHE